MLLCIAYMFRKDLSHGPNSVYIAAITLSVKFVSITVVILSKLTGALISAYRL